MSRVKPVSMTDAELAAQGWTDTTDRETGKMVLNTGINGRAELTIRAVVSFDSPDQLGRFASWVSDALHSQNGENGAVARSFLEAAERAMSEADDIERRFDGQFNGQ